MNSHLTNRDVSWLSFNERVLQEAMDPRLPVIERLRFLGIYSNNLDEFFRVRVATNIRLRSALKSESPELSRYYSEVIQAIGKKVLELQQKFHQTYREIIEELKTENIYFRNENELTETQAQRVRSYFVQEVESLITPIILNNLKKFPYLKDKSVYLFIVITKKNGKKIRALIELPTDYISRFLIIKGDDSKSKSIVFLDDVIRYNLPYVFALFDAENIESHTIKLTRDAALDLDDDFSQSYYNKVEQSLKKRKKGQIVRFVHDKEIGQESLDFILKEIDMKNSDNIIAGSRYHNSRDFIDFPDLGDPRLQFSAVKDIEHKDLKDVKSILKKVERKDILFQFPFHSFDYIIDIIREASIDPKVTRIKISLYRLASKSKIIKALKNAARNGKQVEVVIELQARFDEEANLEWSQQLVEENINVRFGIQGLKVHSKLLVIHRKSKGKIKSYAYVGTGNFHEKTSKIYCDTGLFTSNIAITEEVERVFQLIEKPYMPFQFEHLLVAPVNLRKAINKLIEAETKAALAGKKALIFIKVNNLVDDQIVLKLKAAAEAGVQIKLLVRGVCALTASTNIQIRSIVGRYLEHSRVFYFQNETDPKIYIGSADMMTRNLDVRVEVLAPILNKTLKKELIDYLHLQWSDNVKARVVDEEMRNEFVESDGPEIDSQAAMFTFLS